MEPARRLGCCTWIFGDWPLAETARAVRAAGLDGVELFGAWRGRDPAGARTILDDHGLAVFSLTPADADISHPDRSVRARALDYYRGLADFAAALGAPMFGLHGLVGRIRPLSTRQEEDALLADSTAEICAWAAERGLTVAFEMLNRYESHQIRTMAEGLDLLRRVGAGNLSLLADAYHMNIEEADPAAALRMGGKAIGLYHAADSNRAAPGEGHTDFAAQIAALDAIGYSGPIVLEHTAPGADPFAADKGAGFRDEVRRQLAHSRKELRAMGR